MGNLTTQSGFNVSVSNMTEAMSMATMISKSQLAPPAYKNKPEDALVAMMMGSELGLNPIQSMQNIAVINGKPSIYGDAMLALVQNHPSFGGIEESFDDETLTATCTVWRKGGSKHTQRFSKFDAESAGLWNKSGPWKQYPKRMLAMRARGYALRNQFADALLGLISAEEAQDMPRTERDVTPADNVVSLDAPRYLSKQQALEIESMAQDHPALIEKIKKAYGITTLTELEVSKLDECKARITKFLEAQNGSN